MNLVLILCAVLLEFPSLFAQNEEDCLKIDTSLICKHIIPTGFYPEMETLNITNIELKRLDFNLIHSAFPNLGSLSIVGNNKSQLSRMEMPREKMRIRVLELTLLQITSFRDNFTSYFSALEVLNISENFITDFPKFSFGGLKEVYLSGNKWNCSKSLEWALRLNQTVFKDLENLRCFRMPHNNKPVLAIAEFRRITAETCTFNCSCHLIKCVTNIINGTLEPIIEVNCSSQGLTSLPDTFPPKTKIIHLENNFIQDLSPLRTNLMYRDVLDMYLDNNEVSNLHILEGSAWMTRFRVFSLRENKITELPIYAIDNALQHNVNMPNAVGLRFGNNPWRCDCQFTPKFKEMLQKYALQILDLRDIRCEKGDENANVPIVELPRESVCHSPSEYTIQEALDLLNGILGFLIVFVLGKLAYDYYHFKKTGRLPWIVTKLP